MNYIEELHNYLSIGILINDVYYYFTVIDILATITLIDYAYKFYIQSFQDEIVIGVPVCTRYMLRGISRDPVLRIFFTEYFGVIPSYFEVTDLVEDSIYDEESANIILQNIINKGEYFNSPIEARIFPG